MGLDMYLYRKTYVKNWNFMKPEERHTITVLKGGQPTAIKPERISEITEEVAYWRKANAIHKWFVDNVQDGIDDCREAYVSREQLTSLRDLCVKVLQSTQLEYAKIQNGTKFKNGQAEPIMEDGERIINPEAAAEILPTESGFFFGSTDYDQYYSQDIRETAETLTALLAEPEGDGDFYYHSSW